jgi:uncharacterized membrane protein YgdD (TMEM256/DUF423 family)
MPYWPAIAAIAALEGAFGVVLAAATAHVENNSHLETASQFLMLHAAAGLALAALAASVLERPRWLRNAAFALQAGVLLFSCDLAARAFINARLFPMAAPIGGSLIIVSWLAIAAWAFLALGGRSTKSPN